MHEQTAQALLAVYRQAATLKLLPRTGWLQRGVAQAESVAEHIFGVTLLSLLVGDTIPGIDRSRVLALALLHDLAEVYVSDLPASARRFIGADVKQQAERLALSALLEALPAHDSYLALWDDYASGGSVEARLVKALDRLELLAQALAYEHGGHRTLDEFWQNANQGWDEFPLLQAIADDMLRRKDGSV